MRCRGEADVLCRHFDGGEYLHCYNPDNHTWNQVVYLVYLVRFLDDQNILSNSVETSVSMGKHLGINLAKLLNKVCVTGGKVFNIAETKLIFFNDCFY